MKRYGTQTDVESGLYFNPRSFRFRSLDDPGRLPGSETDRYYRVPLLVLLVAGPLLGLAFVIFLPLIGLVMGGSFLLQQIAKGISGLGRRFARALRFGQRPIAIPSKRPATGSTGPRHQDGVGDEKGLAHHGRHVA